MNTKHIKYTILLFYKYTRIENPELARLWQKNLCENLNIKGRIIIAKEGINATLEGTQDDVKKYLKEYLSLEQFKDTHIKKSEGDGKAFPKLSVKVRDEIVSLQLGSEDFSPEEVTGKKMKPQELFDLIQNNKIGKQEDKDENKEYVIVDMRNDYEHKVGHFKDSILPKLENFRDLKREIKNLENIKNKKVITVCTGGVRCEKASGFLVKNGFSDVYQLDGGIVSYMEKYKNDDFKGSLYVFDDRVTMTYTPDKERTIIGKCDFCSKPTEKFRNCQSATCHKHFLYCGECQADQEKVFCSEGCLSLVR